MVEELQQGHVLLHQGDPRALRYYHRCAHDKKASANIAAVAMGYVSATMLHFTNEKVEEVRQVL
eukprot:gene11977-3539_t